MPAAFTVTPQDYTAILKELKSVDSGLVNELRRELRSELQPIAKALAGNAPAKSPLSGFTKGRGGELPYLWRKPTASISVSGRAKPGRTKSLVAIKFKQPAFNILELAGTANKGKDKGGMTQRGRNLVQGLQTAGYGLGDGGRWVIPQFYRQESSVATIAAKVLSKYADKVNRKLKGGKR